MRRTKGYYNGKPIYSLYVNKKNIIKPFGDTDFQAMFNNGEQGFFYNPNDLKTVSQDAAGITAVNTTVQPVGLLLDKSKSLAYDAERIMDGNFESGLIGTKTDGNGSVSTWTLNTVNPISGSQDGNLVITTTSTTFFPRLTFPSLPKVIGSLYEVSFNYKVISGVANIGLVYNGSGTNVVNLNLTGSGTAKFKYIAIGTGASEVLYFGNSVCNIQIDNFSTKQIMGNHAVQSTTAARPIFRQKPILGSELIPALDFTVAWKGLPATTSVSAKSFTTTELGGVSLALPLEPSKQYQVTLSYTINNPSVTVQILSGVSGAGTVVSTGTSLTRSVIMSGGNPSGYSGVYIRSNGAATVTVNSISLKEITGYRTDQNYIEYDGVDDKLITNLPSALTNCTVLRAITNVGTQVKYNQTLPMLYEDSTNHSGLLAINRDLTRKEQTILMEEFDRRAGATSLETLTFKTFDNNQQGFVYDPNDLSTMFQDAAGTVPVTAAGQPVGLILDKSKGLVLSPELVTNGDFSNGNANWTVKNADSTHVVTFSGGKVRYQADTTTPVLALEQVGVIVTGKWYEVTVVCSDYVSGSLKVDVGNGGIVVASGLGTFKTKILARTNTLVLVRNVANVDLTIDSISVKEIQGNHAYQSTSASRPILRQNAVTGANYLEFDGVDDFLETSDVPSLNESTVIAGTRLRRTTGTHPIIAKGTGGYPYLSSSMFFIQITGDSFRVANNTNGDTQLAQYLLNGSSYIETQKGSASSQTGNGLKTSGKFFIARFNATSTTATAAYDLYGLIVIGKVLPANQYKEVTNYLKNKMGI